MGGRQPDNDERPERERSSSRAAGSARRSFLYRLRLQTSAGYQVDDRGYVPGAGRRVSAGLYERRGAGRGRSRRAARPGSHVLLASTWFSRWVTDVSCERGGKYGVVNSSVP